MKYLNVLVVFFKGLFGWVNNPDRWWIKKKHHEIQVPVEEAKAQAKVEKIEDDAKIHDIKREAKIEKKTERIADKKELGPMPNLKKKRTARKKATKTTKDSRKANRG